MDKGNQRHEQRYSGKGKQMKSRAVEWEAGRAAAQFVPGIACAKAV